MENPSGEWIKVGDIMGAAFKTKYGHGPDDPSVPTSQLNKEKAGQRVTLKLRRKDKLEHGTWKYRVEVLT